MRQKKEADKRAVQKETREGIQTLRREQVARKSQVVRQEREYTEEMKAKKNSEKRE